MEEVGGTNKREMKGGREREEGRREDSQLPAHNMMVEHRERGRGRVEEGKREREREGEKWREREGERWRERERERVREREGESERE